jgi:hypothetical protein
VLLTVSKEVGIGRAIVVCNVSNRIKEGTGIGKYLETASDEEKLKWVEENVEVQRKDLLQARHQIPRLRQFCGNFTTVFTLLQH